MELQTIKASTLASSWAIDILLLQDSLSEDLKSKTDWTGILNIVEERIRELNIADHSKYEVYLVADSPKIRLLVRAWNKFERDFTTISVFEL